LILAELAREIFSSHFLSGVVIMPTVARLGRNIRIEQRYREHNPPHFHAIQGNEEVGLAIADLSIEDGVMNAQALHDVRVWAEEHRAELALNWVPALAQMPLRKIGYP
jgi:hypothetical protein